MNSELQIRTCDISHIDKILSLQDRIIDALSSKNLLRENTREMFVTCVNEPHKTFGVWDNDTLVAIGILYMPGDDSENILKSIDPALVAVKSANYKLCLVDKSYRGQRLQQRLGHLVEKEAMLRGAEYLCATISPDNEHSIKNALALGFEYKKTTEKYGLIRNLYTKKLEQ